MRRRNLGENGASPPASADVYWWCFCFMCATLIPFSPPPPLSFSFSALITTGCQRSSAAWWPAVPRDSSLCRTCCVTEKRIHIVPERNRTALLSEIVPLFEFSLSAPKTLACKVINSEVSKKNIYHTTFAFIHSHCIHDFECQHDCSLAYLNWCKPLLLVWACSQQGSWN